MRQDIVPYDGTIRDPFLFISISFDSEIVAFLFHFLFVNVRRVEAPPQRSDATKCIPYDETRETFVLRKKELTRRAKCLFVLKTIRSSTDATKHLSSDEARETFSAPTRLHVFRF